jgi:hypothetical protein
MNALLMLFALAVASAGPQDRRVEVEIHQKQFEVGPVRYSIPLSVDGGAPVEAMLDTGSTGLRLLPSAGPLQAKAGRSHRYTYRNGVVLTGAIGSAKVMIGSFETRIDVSATSAVSCSQERPSCPAAATTPELYRIGGSTPFEGYSAILGAGLRAGDAENPLVHLGDEAWIVLLPKVGEAAPGKLILNPTSAERAKFTVFSLAKDPHGSGSFWADNTVPVCLLREDGASLCAPALLDSGAVGLNYILRSPPPSADWLADAKVSLTFGPSENQALKQSFVLGRGPAARLNFSKPPASLPWEGLNTGVLPFYDFAILYDAKAGAIGLARREDFLAP